MDSIERQFQRLLASAGIDVDGLFSAWTGWVIGSMASEAITLLVDETKLGQHQHLGVMVVGGGAAITWMPIQPKDR